MVNDNLSHYRGELQIVLREIANDGERNTVGSIPQNEHRILDLHEKHLDHLFGFIKPE